MAKKTDLIGQLQGQIVSMVEATDRLVKEGATAEELARHYVTVRELYDHLGAVNDALSELKNKIAYDHIPNAFEAQGLSTITLKEGYRVTVQGLVRASTRDMEKGIKWLDEHNMASLAKRTINAQTLAALAKDMMTRAEELPGDIFNVHFGHNTSITKVK